MRGWRAVDLGGKRKEKKKKTGVGEKERKRQKIYHLVGGLNAGSDQSTTLCFLTQHIEK
jgi:hypothetical protein